jgi:hypothetical protein
MFIFRLMRAQLCSWYFCQFSRYNGVWLVCVHGLKWRRGNRGLGSWILKVQTEGVRYRYPSQPYRYQLVTRVQVSFQKVWYRYPSQLYRYLRLTQSTSQSKGFCIDTPHSRIDTEWLRAKLNDAVLMCLWGDYYINVFVIIH